MRPGLLLLFAVIALAPGCDVEASLGGHDASVDAAHDGSSDASVDSPAPSCSPPDASACIACEASMCCDAFAACAAAATCPCIVDCVLTGHEIGGCMTHCGGPDHGEHAPLITCAEGHCGGACP